MVLGNVTKNANSSNTGKSNVKCHYCGRVGHYKRDCWKLNGKPK